MEKFDMNAAIEELHAFIRLDNAIELYNAIIAFGRDPSRIFSADELEDIDYEIYRRTRSKDYGEEEEDSLRLSALRDEEDD